MASIGFFPHDAAWGLYIKFSMLITAGTETFIKLLLLWKHNSQSLMQQKKPKMVPITEQVNNQHCTFKRGGGMYVLFRFLECNTCFFLHRSAVQAGMGDCTFFIYIYLYYELIWVTSVPFSTWNTVNNRRTQAEARVAELMLHQLRIMLLYYTGFPLSATGWNV